MDGLITNAAGAWCVFLSQIFGWCERRVSADSVEKVDFSGNVTLSLTLSKNPFTTVK
jgi:hypothetical protein